MTNSADPDQLDSSGMSYLAREGLKILVLATSLTSTKILLYENVRAKNNQIYLYLAFFFKL